MRAIFLTLKWLGLTVLPLTGMVLTLWWFMGTAGSLAIFLTPIAKLLPAGQHVEVRDVSGSVRHGGHVGWLRWQQGDLSVELHDLSMVWDLAPLLQKHLQLQELSVATVDIDDRRAPSAPSPAPDNLSLPLTLDIPFKIAHLKSTGSNNLEVSEIAGKYSFDSDKHRFYEGYARIASGTYHLSGELQAQAPMALQLQLAGEVQTTLPPSRQPLAVTATARLSGPLAGRNAALELQASLKPTSGADGMQAEVTATIAPWQAQPLTQATARWSALNLSTLWPQAPQTQLAGHAEVTPKEDTWTAHLDLNNTIPGPWNEQRLPVTALATEVNYSHEQWRIQSLQIDVAGGRLTGSGQIQAGQWLGSATLQGVHPAALDTRLKDVPVSGELKAQQTSGGIGFSVAITATGKLSQAAGGLGSNKNALSASANRATLQLQAVQVEGLWSEPQLSLTDLQLKTADAQLSGQLTFNTRTLASQAKLSLVMPGLQASLDGHLASQDGQGQLSVQAQDSASAAAWLARLPGLSQRMNGLNLHGSGQLQAHWQGGWQTTGGAGPSLHLDALGQAQVGRHSLNWQVAGGGGQSGEGHWLGQLTQLAVRAQDNAHPGVWTFALGNTPQPSPTDNNRVSIDWQDLADTQRLLISAGQAQLTGPMPGRALLSWQPMTWTQGKAANTPSPRPPAHWQSLGQFSQLPLSWADALSGKSMAGLDLSSDLLLNGKWNAQQANALQVGISIERSSGDVRLRTEITGQQALPALLQEARLDVNLAGNQLSGSLRWDSERAGKALMAFSTELQTNAQGFAWPQQAPVGGSLQMQLPPVDAWSVLAPPGWRLRGTLLTNATLTGTREHPLWQGTLQADNLAVRSLADGIDFQQGSLRTHLDGQQLHIDDFTLYGSGGQTGGLIKITGLAEWLPDARPTGGLTNHVHMALQAKAQTLRLSTRSDRQVSVSGVLNAELAANVLSLDGKLGVDKALIILPSESAPVLGDDVVVRPSASAASSPLPNPSTPAVKQAAGGAQSAPAMVAQVQVDLDLGDSFQVRGRGLDTRLTGQLQMQASGGASPSLRGTVRTRRGTFAAYGQKLEIEQGVLRFVGPFDNPALDILAIRPKLSQRVGVQVLGTAQSPVIRLYADPELPEAEKLAWLVLGRSASGSGGEAAMLQQAALALLAGSGRGPSASLTQALGLDELSFRSASDTSSGTGITLGKRLSNDFYVAYENGLAGTVGVFTIFYDLSKHLTLRAHTGGESAVDLIWTTRFD